LLLSRVVVVHSNIYGNLKLATSHITSPPCRNWSPNYLFLVLNSFILRNNIPCDKLTKSFGMRYSTSYANLGLKIQENLLTHPSANRHQRYLTLVIKWEPVCPTWPDAVLTERRISFFFLFADSIRYGHWEKLDLLLDSIVRDTKWQLCRIAPGPPKKYLSNKFLNDRYQVAKGRFFETLRVNILLGKPGEQRR
jgi:hypothetical protein